MYTVKGYCAGILVFTEDVDEEKLKDFLNDKKLALKDGDLKITFGAGITQVATELCYDVYDKATGVWRKDLSRAFKK